MNSDLPEDIRSPLLRRAGTILAISYPVLALSTGFRSVYQLFLKEEVVNYMGPALSGVAACAISLPRLALPIGVAGPGGLSVGVLGFESFMTVLIGILSIHQS